MKRNIIVQGLYTLLLAASMVTHGARAAPILSTPALPATVTAGQHVGVDVLVADAQDLFAWQFTLLFDPTVLHWTGADEGGFLARGGDLFFDADGSAAGSVIAIASLYESAGVTGGGRLAHFDFSAIAAGGTGLRLADPLLIDSNFNDLGAVVATPPGAGVPEPASLALLALAVGVMLVVQQRRRS